MLACGVAAVSVVATVSLVAPSARAATMTAISLSASAASIAYGTQETLSGQLTAGAVGLANEPVSITEGYGGAVAGPQVATATTDSSGDFSVTVTLAAAGKLEATFAGAAGYGASTSATVLVSSPGALPTPAVTLSPQAKSAVAAGTTLTFTGKATITVNGTTQPLAGAPVVLWTGGPGYPVPGGVVTSPDGTFTLTAPADSGPLWQAVVIPPEYGLSGAWLYNESFSAMETVAVEYNTRIIDFKAPAKAETHSDSFRVSGVVQQWNGSRWEAADYPLVSLYYQALPSARWVKLPGELQAWQSTGGSFSFQVTQDTPLGHIRWKAVVAKQESGDEIFATSTSSLPQTWVVDHTYEEDLYTFRGPGYTNIEAYIRDQPSRSRDTMAGYPAHGMARLYYHPRGTTKWTYLGEKRTDSIQGFVGWSETRDRTGYFEIVFPAQGNYLGSSAEVKVG